MFRPAFGCVQHPKAGRNTQHTYCAVLGTKHNHSCNFSDLYNRLSSSSAEDIENLVYKYLREDVDYPKHMLFTLASKIAQYITYKVI